MKYVFPNRERASQPTKWNGISKFQYLLPTVIVNRLTFPVIKGLVEFKEADGRDVRDGHLTIWLVARGNMCRLPFSQVTLILRFVHFASPKLVLSLLSSFVRPKNGSGVEKR